MPEAVKNPLNIANLDRQKILERVKDLSYLPTHDDIKKVFDSYEEKKVVDYEGKESTRASISDDDFYTMFEKGKAFEVLNKEFIGALADCIEKNIVNNTPDNPYIILEICAGNGRLAHFLREEFGRRVTSKVRVMAADNMEREIEPIFDVEKMDAKDALEKYKPDLVLVSWMPMNLDLSVEIRAAPSVREYILVGDTGSTGEPEATWGEARDDDGNARPWGTYTPAYKADGFEESPLREVSSEQIIRGSGSFGYSYTYAFTREPRTS